jgi:hypothetical protein
VTTLEQHAFVSTGNQADGCQNCGKPVDAHAPFESLPHSVRHSFPHKRCPECFPPQAPIAPEPGNGD